MAWTAPMTAVANTAFTAAQFNTHVRDNLNQTAPALATAAGTLFVGNGVNAIVQRTPTGDTVTASVSTASTTYTDLSGSAGPAITMVTGAQAFIWIACAIQNDTADKYGYMSVAVSGATTVAASDQWGMANPSRLVDSRLSVGHLFTGLTPGSNVFTAKYRTQSNNCSFANREIMGIPL